MTAAAAGTISNGSVEEEYPYPPMDDDNLHDEASLASMDHLALQKQQDLERSLNGGATASAAASKRRRRRWLMTSACLVLVGIIVLTAVLASKKNTNSNSNGNGDRGGTTGGSDGVDRVEGGEEALGTASPMESQAYMVLSPIVRDASRLEDPASPEGQAFEAVSVQDDLTDPDEISSQYALLTVFYATNGNGWVNNNGWLLDQNMSHCQWHGIQCNSDGKITSMMLGE